MKLRTVPYGYLFEDGVIEIHPQERETVTEICKAYLGGDSLLQIAERLNANGIEYMPGVAGWNKARLKRIIEDERYLGKEPYPTILDQGTFDAMQCTASLTQGSKTVRRDGFAKIPLVNGESPCPTKNCSAKSQDF